MNLARFGSWALDNGIVATPKGSFGGECVSLVQQMLDQVIGIPFQGRGNAKDWEYNTDVLSHFNKLPVGTPLIPGDILVYGKPYGYDPKTNQYFGHVGIIDVNGNYLDQNGIKSRRVAYKSNPFGGYRCILRSKTPFELRDKVGFLVGQRVTLQGFATNYATGQFIPVSVRNKIYTIAQVEKGKVLLKEIMSWVLNQDIR